MQTNHLTVLFILVFGLFCSPILSAQDIPQTNSSTIKAVDTVISPKRPIIAPLFVPEGQKNQLSVQDSVKTDSIRETLSAIVDYSATDYTLFERKTQKLYLYNEAVVSYTDINITAGQIIVDNATNTVFAKGIVDSAGTYTQGPVFVQANSTIEPDSIIFNFKTEKARVFGSRTQQGEFYVMNELSKRVNDSVVFMKNVRFTTSKNLEDPEYYFYARRVKFVPGKKIVTGLVNMFIADVPTPLGIPFAYFPMEKETSVSGFILPSPGEDNDRGYFLQNGGYYFALSEYFDLTMQGDYYTNGSYGIRATSTYKKRYSFSGNLRVTFDKLVNSERGLPDYSLANNYNIAWSHSQDTKASPNSRFSASVNLGSSDFYRQSININNIGNRLQNTLSSSVSYSKTFQSVPQVNLSLTATHSQSTSTGIINMTLPTLQVNVDRIYPFAPSSGTKKGIIQNINFNYSGTGANRFMTTDEEFFTAQMFKDAETGIRHNIPITTNFKLFNYFSVSAGSSYQESWVFETIKRDYNAVARKVVEDTISGFDAFRTYNFSTSIGTTIYGQFNFGEDKKVQAIRHIIKPSVSFNYNPAFDQYYETYLAPEANDPEGARTREVEYSRFDGGFYGAPSNFRSSGVSLSLNNTVEAKVRDKDSTAVEPKKITLLNNLSVSTNYNFLADSLKLSPLRLSGTIPIIESKLSINFNMTLDPYALNNNNQRIDKLNIANGGSLLRLTRASANFGYAFSSKSFNKKTENEDRDENETFRNGGRPDALFGKSIDNINGEFYEEEEPEGEEDAEEQALYNYTLPWNLRVQYNVNYGNMGRQDMITSHVLNFSGDVELGDRWFVGTSAIFDLSNGKFVPSQIRFRRDLESFNMTFSWTPFGTYKSYNFFIGIKSSALSDLKYEQRKPPDRQL